MLRLPLRTLFSLTPSRSRSPYSILIPQCSTSSPPHLTYSHSHSHPDSRNVRVSVWWDLDKCNQHYGVNVFRGAQAITAAIKSSGIKGPIEIKAFGDMACLAKTTQEIQEALPSTAIQFSHIPPDENYSAHSSLFYGLMGWVSRNPSPAHLFLIIADEDCASLVHHLRMKNYNILLASKKPLLTSKEPAPAVLRTAATIIWHWDVLVNERLGYLTRCCSWYDHDHYDGTRSYDGPLEDPSESPEVEPGVFSHDSFWRGMETFFNTERGSFIIEESRSSRVRQEMAYYLEKYGPSYIKSLPKSDVLFVVDRLIEENDWWPY